MIAKKYLSLAMLCSLLTAQNSKSMEAWTLDTKNSDTVDEKNIVVTCFDDHEKPLFYIEMPSKALAHSKTLTNVFSDSDEEHNTIPLYASQIHTISPNALESALMILKDFSQHQSPEIFIKLIKKPFNELLEIVNAASYLSCTQIYTYLITCLMMNLRSSIHDIPSLTNALHNATFLTHTDHIDHLLSYAPCKNFIDSCIKDETILKEHSKLISALCCSQKDALLASASWDQTIKIWDTTTNSCIKNLIGHEGNITSLAFSGDGKKLISCCDMPSIKIWDLETESCIKTFDDESITCATLSPINDKLIAFGIENSLFICPDYTHETTLYELNGHADEIGQIIFSPSGDYLASSDDTTIKIWNTKDYLCKHTLKGHQQSITTMSFSADGKKLISADLDGIIIMWDIATAQQIMKFEAHETPINTVSFASSNNIFASGADDGILKLWNASTGECLNSLQTTSAIKALSFTHDSSKLAAGLHDNTLHLYSFLELKSAFSLPDLLLFEYLLHKRHTNDIQKLPTQELYLEIFSHLPEQIQRQFSQYIDQFALKNYLSKATQEQ